MEPVVAAFCEVCLQQLTRASQTMLLTKATGFAAPAGSPLEIGIQSIDGRHVNFITASTCGSISNCRRRTYAFAFTKPAPQLFFFAQSTFLLIINTKEVTRETDSKAFI
ncbi:hypothetical protein ACFQEX_08600 [Roseibium salinum]|uniref:hypothetical protein n=1 Tax=Roseibium salinum TaxID=1604349 RepID=UPI0036239C79